jgi:hypothetical protein
MQRNKTLLEEPCEYHGCSKCVFLSFVENASMSILFAAQLLGQVKTDGGKNY